MLVWLKPTLCQSKDGIVYFKGKGEFIVFGNMNACTRNLQLDTQQPFMSHNSRMQDDIQMHNCSFIFMPHISRMQHDIQLHNFSFIDEKALDQFGMLLLQMCNNT